MKPDTEEKLITGEWVPARYETYPCIFIKLRGRLKDAWLVFTGKAEAVIWE